jgi:hypothetical protein
MGGFFLAGFFDKEEMGSKAQSKIPARRDD